jgi:hypothetical protein
MNASAHTKEIGSEILLNVEIVINICFLLHITNRSIIDRILAKNIKP